MKKLSKFVITTLFVIVFDWPCFSQGFYNSFNWNSFQGMDFVTQPRDQEIQGPCHIFAAIAQVESLFELLYYNPSVGLELSEHFLYSPCTEYENPDLMYPFLQNNGVIEERTAYAWVLRPHYGSWTYKRECTGGDPNDTCCTNPSRNTYKYRISYSILPIENFTSIKQIQDAVYNYGPIQMWFKYYFHGFPTQEPHALLLIGWATISNKLYWIFKDSWPDAASDNYQLKEEDLHLIDRFKNPNVNNDAKIITAVNRYKRNGLYAWNLDNIQRSCNGDHDGDGYCFWGVGSKPCTHGSSLQQDFNDNDRTKGPLLTDGLTKGYAMPIPNMNAPVGQMVINGPNQTGHCLASHSINSNYWTNISGDDYIDWVPYSGSTPTTNTGPDNNAPGATGLYLYLEPTGGCFNMNGIVESKNYYYIPSTGYSLKYYYHMYGTTMGTLKVKIQTYPDPAWVEYGVVKSGNKGLNWWNEVISLNQFNGRYIKIRFEGITGSGEYSDMAIQNISIPYVGTKSTGTNSTNDQANPEKQNQVFTLYPNPTSGQLFINTTEPLDYHLFIYNTSGKLVYGKRLNSNQIIDVGTLPKGMYIVRIKYNDQGKNIFTEEIIIN